MKSARLARCQIAAALVRFTLHALYATAAIVAAIATGLVAGYVL